MRSAIAWPIMLSEDAANDILVDRDAESVSDLLGDTHTAELGIAPLHLNNHRDEFRGRAFWTRLTAVRRGREEQTVFAIHQSTVKFEERGRFEQRAQPCNPTWAHEQRSQAEHEPIDGGEIRRTFSAPIADEQLVLQQQRFCGDGTYTTWADQLCERDQ